eukprot:TRINITY_DN6373_c0_g1_i2.p1 TRINITY_DN6373_c0_g1~~TRINITY_DN6373_c0_g1_i2.p1  ORF type:complete len:265 (-),score=67.13 TRINITY_DN6373_c0_g1_i2:113-907(-)
MPEPFNYRLQSPNIPVDVFNIYVSLIESFVVDHCEGIIDGISSGCDVISYKYTENRRAAPLALVVSDMLSNGWRLDTVSGGKREGSLLRLTFTRNRSSSYIFRKILLDSSILGVTLDEDRYIFGDSNRNVDSEYPRTNVGRAQVKSLPLAPIPIKSVPLNTPTPPADIKSLPLAPIPIKSVPLNSPTPPPAHIKSLPLAPIPIKSVPLASSTTPIIKSKVKSLPLAPIPIKSVPLATSSSPVDEKIKSLPLAPIPIKVIPLKSK